MTHPAPVTRTNAAGRGASGSRARSFAAALLLGALVLMPSFARAAAPRVPRPATLAELRREYVVLLTRHRPDLAERRGVFETRVPFVPLDAASLPVHANALRTLLAQTGSLAPGAERDTLRAWLTAELADSAPDGVLATDPLVWFDIVVAAARAPFVAGKLSACARAHHSAQQLARIPEALRGAAVLTAGHAVDPVAFEARVSAAEAILRHDLPERTKACMETRRRGEFVEADSLAAASFAKYRRWVLTPH